MAVSLSLGRVHHEHVKKTKVVLYDNGTTGLFDSDATVRYAG